MARRIMWTRAGGGAPTWHPKAETIAAAERDFQAHGPFNSKEEWERQFFRPGTQTFYDGRESRRTREVLRGLSDSDTMFGGEGSQRKFHVYTPAGIKKKGIFKEPRATSHENRFDCAQGADGEWYCVYTDQEYNTFYQKILDNEREVAERRREEKKKTAALLKKTKENKPDKFKTDQELLQEQLDEAFKLSEEERLRLRQQNSQLVTFMAMKDITTHNSKVNYSARGHSIITAPKVTQTLSPREWSAIKEQKPRKLNYWVSHPDSFVNNIINPYGAGDFFCADPGQLSALVPMVDFYLEVGADATGKSTYSRVAFSDFTDGAKAKTLAKVGYSDPSAVLKNRGTLGTDVGITSFDWEWNNEHEGSKVLQATLVLHFRSIRELNNQKYLDFVGLDQRNKKGVSSSKTGLKSYEHYHKKHGHGPGSSVRLGEDLAKIKKKALDVEDFEILEYTKLGDKYPKARSSQLKVVVGWATPKGPGADKLLSTGFKAALNRSRKTLYLDLMKYEVDFGQEGQVSLTLQYNGSLDSFLEDLDSSNIFELNDIATKSYIKPYTVSAIYHGFSETPDTGIMASIMRGMRREQVNLLEGTYWYTLSPSSKLVDIRGGKKMLVEGPGILSTYAVKGERNVEVEEGVTVKEPTITVSMSMIDAEIERLKMLRHYWQLKIRTRTRSRSQRGLPPSAEQKMQLDAVNRWLGTAEALKSQVQFEMSTDMNSVFLGSLLRSGNMYYLRVGKNLIKNPQGGSVMGAYIIHAKDDGKSSGGAGRERENKAAAAAKAVQDQTKGKIGKKDEYERTVFSLDPLTPTGRITPDSQVNVYYIRLGDLLDQVWGHVPERSGIDPILGTFQPGRLGVPGYLNKDEVVSIADIPISVDYFAQWWLDNIAKKGIHRMSIRNFLNTVLNRLIAPLFNNVWNERLQEGVVNDRIRFDFTAASVPYNLKDEIMAIETTGNVIDWIVNGVNMNRINVEYAEAFGRLNVPEKHLMLISASHKRSSRFLWGDRVLDEMRGIYHLVLGSECNVVKSFGFTEKRMPQLRAQRIENSIQGVGGLLHLPQDCEVVMFGNTFFKNGSLVYINAEFGLGRAATDLGIGGYYRVYKVSNTIESGNFETRLSLMREMGPGAIEV